MRERILFIDDDKDQCELMCLAFEQLGYKVFSTTSPHQALKLVENTQYDVIFTDLGMDEMDGVQLCERLTTMNPDIPVIVLTGQGSIESAIAAMKSGAFDFLTKPVDIKLSTLSVSRAIQHRELHNQIKRLQAVAGHAQSEGILIGESNPMRRVRDLISRVGPSEASIVIQGETGTGKELVAHALHHASSRSKGPFIAVNCAALPPQLLESELFGHTRGAFTDAKSARQGLFLQASNGTLFLDEIGELPLDVQAKLLRALQERQVRPVGSDHEISFDTRILAASHRDLEVEVEEGRFRQDLYYRINVVKIEVPPLRERGNDILKLANFFLEKGATRNRKEVLKFSSPVAEKMLAYSWPGNVRELENAMERAIALARFDHLTLDDLPEKVRTHKADSFMMSADEPSDIVTLQELEHKYIQRVVKLLNGNKSRAAQLLGLDRRTLYRKLERTEKRVSSTQRTDDYN